MWYDRETQQSDEEVHDPRTQPLVRFQSDDDENAPRSVRSTDWAENPQVACNRFEATVVMKLHIERTTYNTFLPTCPAGSVRTMAVSLSLI